MAWHQFLAELTRGMATIKIDDFVTTSAGFTSAEHLPVGVRYARRIYGVATIKIDDSNRPVTESIVLF